MKQLFNDNLQKAGSGYLKMKTIEGYLTIGFTIVCVVALVVLVVVCFKQIGALTYIF
jgi:hypothetical protein